MQGSGIVNDHFTTNFYVVGLHHRLSAQLDLNLAAAMQLLIILINAFYARADYLFAFLLSCIRESQTLSHMPVS